MESDVVSFKLFTSDLTSHSHLQGFFWKMFKSGTNKSCTKTTKVKKDGIKQRLSGFIHPPL